MEKILELARGLADAFTACEAYAEYTNVKSRIENDPELSLKITEFEKAAEAFEAKRGGEGVSFDEERIISNMYTDIWLNGDGRAYFTSLSELYKALGEIYDILENGCKI